MNLTCGGCQKSFEVTDTWPGDVVKCAHCGADVSLPKAETVAYATSTPYVALSPHDLEVRPTALSDEEILPPGALLGQYRIDKFIGRGGMGSVYKAQHTLLQRTVAVKVLPPKFAADPEFVQRFKREALALANLSHPNIVAIHDMGQQGEIYFFVMEFVEGANLRDLLVAKRIPPEDALKIVPQLCEALEYAHSKGIIHRDIKPENIMLDRNGQAKVADFGLAKIVKGDSMTRALTQTNVVMGTLEYMAPEQRDNMKTVDHRADIYSMGVVLYEMLTGELPVGRFEPPSRKVTIDVRVDDVVLKALEHEPGRRYQRASHMGTDVSQVRVSRVSPRELPLLELATGKAVGTAVGRGLAVRAGEAEVRVTTWGRDEIGFQAEGGYALNAEQQPPVLQARGDTESIDLQVPKGVELDIITTDGAVTVSGFSGILSVRAGDGDVTARDVEGRIGIATGDGAVSISGLKGEEIELRSAGGDIEISRLGVARGRVAIDANDGSVDVGLAPEASLRYQIHSNGGDIEAPAGAALAEKSASGCIGTGAASLSIRTGDGDVVLRTGAKPALSAETVRDIWSKLTPKQIEKIGVFAIVNAALWVFFLAVGSPFPAICVTAFWAMGLALDIWKGYVRGGQAPAAPPPVSAAPTAPVPPAPPPGTFAMHVAVETSAPPAPPAAPRRRFSVLALFSVLAGLPALLAACGVGVIGIVAASEGGLDLRDAQGYTITLVVMSSLAFVFGLVASAFGVAGLWSVRETPLYGRTGSMIGLSFGAAGLVAALCMGRPAVDEMRQGNRELTAMGQVVAGSLASGDPAPVQRISADVPEARLAAAHKEASQQVQSLAVRGLRVRRVWCLPGRSEGQIELSFRSATGSMQYVNLHADRKGGRWRVIDAPELFDKIRGE